jgi:hypothetical protein
MAKRINNPNTGGLSKPLLKSQIEEAQRNTQSAAQAARWLEVSYQTYKKYAKIYGIFENHLNPKGVGVSKGFSRKYNSVKLSDIFSNKYGKYSLVRLKYRMLARKMIEEECSLCGFNEKRISDGKIPLILSFKDQAQDYSRENLHLLCYNCTFLTTGSPWSPHKYKIRSSLVNPDFPKSKNDHKKYNDSLDEEDKLLDDEANNNEDGLYDLQSQILDELGR